MIRGDVFQGWRLLRSLTPGYLPLPRWGSQNGDLRSRVNAVPASRQLRAGRGRLQLFAAICGYLQLLQIFFSGGGGEPNCE